MKRDRVAIWGVGNEGRKILGLLINCEVVSFIDTNSPKLYYRGIRIVKPEKIDITVFKYIIVSPVVCDSIYKYINEQGWTRESFIFIHFYDLKDWDYWFHQLFRIKKYMEKEDFYKLSAFGNSMQRILYDPRILNYAKFDLNVENCINFANKRGLIQKYNYEYIDKYLDMDVKVLSDNGSGYSYVLHNDKPFFFPRRYTRKEIILFYRDLLIRNDKRSPIVLKDPATMEVDKAIVVGVDGAFFSVAFPSFSKTIDIYIKDDDWRDAFAKTLKGYEKTFRMMDEEIYEKMSNTYYDYMRVNLDIDNFDICTLLSRARINRLEIISSQNSIREEIGHMFLSHGHRVQIEGGYVYCPEISDFEMNSIFKRGVITGIK